MCPNCRTLRFCRELSTFGEPPQMNRRRLNLAGKSQRPADIGSLADYKSAIQQTKCLRYPAEPIGRRTPLRVSATNNNLVALRPMKACAYCGHDNDDSESRCAACGNQEFEIPPATGEPVPTG